MEGYDWFNIIASGAEAPRSYLLIGSVIASDSEAISHHKETASPLAPLGLAGERSKFVGHIWFRRTKVLPQFVKVGYKPTLVASPEDFQVLSRRL